LTPYRGALRIPDRNQCFPHLWCVLACKPESASLIGLDFGQRPGQGDVLIGTNRKSADPGL